MSNGLAIEAYGLKKRFGETRALSGLSLSAKHGTVLGVLGPNGAGKTTAVRILTTLLQQDEGRAMINGVDVQRDPHHIRRMIGLTGQNAAVDEYLTAQENLEMFGRLYHLGRNAARARAIELLAQFDLSDVAKRPAKTFSGGMRRRLDLAAGLVARPPVLFLDEPTTGLDPRSRLQMWDVIRSLVAEGATLLLTTQYLEEADMLADDIVVIDRGIDIAHGTADELKQRVGGERIEIRVSDASAIDRAKVILAKHSDGSPDVDEATRSVRIAVRHEPGLLSAVARELEEENVLLDDFGLRRPTLDEVFLSLTGHVTEENQ